MIDYEALGRAYHTHFGEAKARDLLGAHPELAEAQAAVEGTAGGSHKALSVLARWPAILLRNGATVRVEMDRGEFALTWHSERIAQMRGARAPRLNDALSALERAVADAYEFVRLGHSYWVRGNK